VITVVSNDSADSQLRSRRIPYCQRVLIAPREGGERSYGECFDLSLGGMFITTMLPYNVGEIVDLEIPLDSLRFTAAVKVIWVRGTHDSEDQPAGMAVEFIGLNLHQKPTDDMFHHETSVRLPVVSAVERRAPRFTDFHLTAASLLAIDTCAPMPGTVDDDFDGLARPMDGDHSGAAEWDIGPHEYSPGIFTDGFETGDLSSWSATVP